ncbi:MAG: preprotein translocase subunit YajC [Deltaproteobacteria bacterium]
MDSLAYAMGRGGAGGDDAGGMSTFIPLMLMFAIFYFLLIRPQQKKAKQHKALLASIKKRDRVVTSGGLHGVITGVADDVVTMEIAPKIRVKVSRGSVAGILKRDESVSTQE